MKLDRLTRWSWISLIDWACAGELLDGTPAQATTGTARIVDRFGDPVTFCIAASATASWVTRYRTKRDKDLEPVQIRRGDGFEIETIRMAVKITAKPMLIGVDHDQADPFRGMQ